MADMGEMEMPLPDNTLPMMSGHGPFGPIEDGRHVHRREGRARGLPAAITEDPGWYKHPAGDAWLTSGRGRRSESSHARCADRCHSRALMNCGRRKPSGARPVTDLTISTRNQSSQMKLLKVILVLPCIVLGRAQPCAHTEKTARPRKGELTISATSKWLSGAKATRSESHARFSVEMSDTMRFYPQSIKVKRGAIVRIRREELPARQCTKWCSAR